MQHFILPFTADQQKILIEEKELVHQMIKVLRFKKGSECVLMDGKGLKAKGRVTLLHKKGAEIEVSEAERVASPKRRVRLICALSKKPSTLEWIVQKAVELRCYEIIPVLTQRGQVTEIRKLERLELIMKEAAEQCENPFFPKLSEVKNLEDILKSFKEGHLSGEFLAGDAWDTDLLLKDAQLLPHEDVNVLIGPEGGLTEEELKSIREVGGRIFLLGESVLRMETAAVAALSVIQFG
jgi:16S rRNA (uracil1498-N3)-methyltransferase